MDRHIIINWTVRGTRHPSAASKRANCIRLSSKCVSAMTSEGFVFKTITTGKVKTATVKLQQLALWLRTKGK